MFKTETEILQFIKRTLSKITDKNWIMITLSIEITSEHTITYNGEYINNIGETKDLFNVLHDEKNILNAFRSLYDMMRNKQKWNNLKLEFIEGEYNLDITFEWNQEIEDEFFKLPESIIKNDELIIEDELELYDYLEQALSDIIAIEENWKREDWDPLYNWLDITINARKNSNTIQLSGQYYNLNNELNDINFSTNDFDLKEVFDKYYYLVNKNNKNWETLKLRLKNKILIQNEEVFVNKKSFYICYNLEKLKNKIEVNIDVEYDDNKHFLHSPMSYNIVKIPNKS